MSDTVKSFLNALQDSYRAYIEHGARSTAKLKPTHQWLADYLQKQLGEKYSMHSMREDNSAAREIKADGRYYEKNVDIGVLYKKEKLVSCIGFKFVTSNYKQNSINYFENMLGETANLQRKNIGYGTLLVLPLTIRYLTRSGTVDRHENITTRNIQKYLELFRDKNFPHKPKALGIVFVDINYQTESVSGVSNIDETDFDSTIKDFLKTKVNLDTFLDNFVKLTKEKAA